MDSGVSFVPTVLDLREIVSGRGGRAHCFVRYSGDREEFAVTRVACTLPGADVRYFELDDEALIHRIMPGVGRTLRAAPGAYLVELSLKPGRRDVGQVRGEVIVDTTIAQYPRITIPIIGEVVSPVCARPTVVSFGEVTNAETIHRRIWLYSTDNRPFNVEGVEAGSVVVKVTEIARADKRAHTVDLGLKGADALALCDAPVGLIIRLSDTRERFSIPLNIYAVGDAHRTAALATRDAAADSAKHVEPTSGAHEKHQPSTNEQAPDNE